jgi:hypothetical protein
MNEKEYEALFDLLTKLLEDGHFNMGGDEFEPIDYKEIIKEIDLKFIIRLREHN